MNEGIAIIGIGCRYPDASSPAALWENVLARRRAFRRIPPERLRLEDYWSDDRTAPDSVYSTEAALIEGYEFDRLSFQVSGSTFRSADMAHWLALDTAASALADAGFPNGKGLPHETTGVHLGNTLTGEFSRANAMRLRWPYVRRVVENALREENRRSPEQRHAFLDTLEAAYKKPFPAVGEETLAGGLANTIAGRICNHFDLKGGGYTVDGACASSLLAVTGACAALLSGDLDVALAGGVDLSIDPFELVGFAKTGALAPDEMRVYDARSAGFWPGEGCGVVVLMRYDEAVEAGRRIYGVIRGWGISSDGSGGMTRPEVEGQLLMLQRAYRRAGFGIDTVSYFEGHGTGTAVGDMTELQALSRVRREAGASVPATIGSIKANIGHTKAAAGIAGLIKATLALHTQIIPPTTGCETPHAELTAETATLQIQKRGELWPAERPLRAGVSAMGFGGINTHIVLENIPRGRRKKLNRQESDLLSSVQDAELFLIGAQNSDDLLERVESLSQLAGRISRAEMADLAAETARTLTAGKVRAAVVASTPAEFAATLDTLRLRLSSGTQLDVPSGLFLGAGTGQPRIGFLFPGQGIPAHLGGGALRHRFDVVQDLFTEGGHPIATGIVGTDVAQPAIAAASVAGLRLLEMFGVRAQIAIGHSLGELVAYHWAGALEESALLRIATARGRAMAEFGNPAGTMASIMAGPDEVEKLLDGEPVAIACINAPRQTVISGERNAVAHVVDRARAKKLATMNLPVSRAFHSPWVAASAPVLGEQLSRETFHPLQRTVLSTITGATLTSGDDLRKLLYRQVTAPVRFAEVAALAERQVDLFIEVGPGAILSGLVGGFVKTPVLTLDVCGASVKGLLKAVGAAFALGTPVNHLALFAGRFTRPFSLDWHPKFFVNPCELAPPSGGAPALPSPASGGGLGRGSLDSRLKHAGVTDVAVTSPLDLVRRLVARRTELPLSSVREESRMLSDLHLNSITVSQLVVEATRSLGLPPPALPMNYANAKVSEISQMLEALISGGSATPTDDRDRWPSGVGEWVRAFTTELVERPLPHRLIPSGNGGGVWHLIAPEDHPLKKSLQEALTRSAQGGGVVVCLPAETAEPDERQVGLLLAGSRAVLTEGSIPRFVLVKHGGGGGAGFARTLHLEVPGMTTCVVDVPIDHPKAAEWAIGEAMSAAGYTEAHYDSSGRRREPVLRHLQIGQPFCHSDEACSPTPPSPARGGGLGRGSLDSRLGLPRYDSKRGHAGMTDLGPSNVWLVTGGGKGITAECALALARETGVRLALLGRARPENDTELAANLDRMTAEGISFQYLVADLLDPEAVQAAVRKIELELGTITGILHGAGRNEPQPVSALDEAALRRTLAPKMIGVRNLLAAVNPDALRLFVTFGSIIARTGMPGEAHYALANEALTQFTERFQKGHPACRCLAIEWSAWSGVGMAHRLGGADRLVRQGITLIPTEEGVSIFRRLLSQKLPTVAVVVTGRFGEPPTLKIEKPELPLLRFLEKPRVYYPGVEMISDTVLSVDTDPYVEDHVFRGERLFPAVIGLEAMAQVAMVLMGTECPPTFEEVSFHRPVTVPDHLPVSIRIAALAHAPSQVEVVLRTEETAFQIDHFRAICRWNAQGMESAPQSADPQGAALLAEPFSPVGIDPQRDLYGGLLFQRGRFQRVTGYRRLMATECVAEIAAEGTTDWFGRYLPGKLVLGDPAILDAAIHAVQVCIPHATILPIGIGRLLPGSEQTSGPWYVAARERSREGDTFTYDLEVTGCDGGLHKRLEGMQLRAVDKKVPRGPWVPPLLGPYIERKVRELIPTSNLRVAVSLDVDPDRHARSDRAIHRALGKTVPVVRRPDGKPEVTLVNGKGRWEVSSAHAGAFTLAVAGGGPIGCDVEPVATRPAAIWRDLLGPERFALAEVIAHETGEDAGTTATRVWAASECLKKSGAMASGSLLFSSSTPDGWVQMTAGSRQIATHVAPTRGTDGMLAMAVLVGSCE